MQQDGEGERRTPDQGAIANQGNQVTTTENDTIQKDAENTRSKGFFETIPPWGYAVAGCVGLLILVVIIVVAVVYGW